MIQRRVFITGRVQGVSFRASMMDVARRYLGIQGFVRNRSDGRVEAVIAGPEAEVQALVDWCRQGPSHAEVTNLEVQDEPFAPPYPDFRRVETV